MITKHLLLIATLVFSLHTVTQAQSDNSSWLDFWLGKWEVTWVKEGKTYKGTNTIFRTLNDKIIQENFEDPGNRYKGMSVSAYNPRQGKWFQTWVDSDGGYLTFTGNQLGENKVFETQIIERNGNKYQQRMVFSNIKSDSFQWRWEGTTDGGTTWTVNWEIHYKRIP